VPPVEQELPTPPEHVSSPEFIPGLKLVSCDSICRFMCNVFRFVVCLLFFWSLSI